MAVSAGILQNLWCRHGERTWCNSHSGAGERGQLRGEGRAHGSRDHDALLRDAAEGQRLAVGGGNGHPEVEALHRRVALPQPLFCRTACTRAIPPCQDCEAGAVPLCCNGRCNC